MVVVVLESEERWVESVSDRSLFLNDPLVISLSVCVSISIYYVYMAWQWHGMVEGRRE